MYFKYFGRNFVFVKCILLRFDYFKKQIGGLKFLNILCMYIYRFQFYGKFGLVYCYFDILYSYNFVDIYVGCLDIMNNIDKDIFLN